MRNRKKMSSKQFTIYVLQLEGGKYYVGKTQNLDRRYAEHQAGECMWTKLYKPVCVMSTVLGDAFDEDKITKQLMAKHGIDNVRGGSYAIFDISKIYQT
jgi:predicted GIY-YIG superfamily endonuclease